MFQDIMERLEKRREELLRHLDIQHPLVHASEYRSTQDKIEAINLELAYWEDEKKREKSKKKVLECLKNESC